jgi:hypothetical protein
MRRALNDVMASAGALLVLLTLLVAVDSRVREQVMLRMSGGTASADVMQAGSRVKDLASVIVDVIADAARMHTTLMIFVIVATVLTVFMVRT